MVALIILFRIWFDGFDGTNDDDDDDDNDDDDDRGAIEQPLEMKKWPRGWRAAVQTGNKTNHDYDEYGEYGEFEGFDEYGYYEKGDQLIGWKDYQKMIKLSKDDKIIRRWQDYQKIIRLSEDEKLTPIPPQKRSGWVRWWQDDKIIRWW